MVWLYVGWINNLEMISEEGVGVAEAPGRAEKSVPKVDCKAVHTSGT